MSSPRHFAKRTTEELDDLLNSCLDELEDEGDFTTTGGEERKDADPEGVHAMEEESVNNLASSMQQLLASMDDPEIMQSLHSTFNRLGELKEPSEAITAMAKEAEKEAGAAEDGQASIEAPSATKLKGDTAPDGLSDVDRTVAKTLELLSKSAQDMEGVEAASVEGAGEDVMKQMMAEFEKLGEKEDYNSVVDNLMQQLLSKELMYDPIKQVCEEYPQWLATHKNTMTNEEYERYGHQYQCMQKVLALYEMEPDNFPRLMELMQDMQEYGQVPAEIVKKLAPGLQFNAEGMPVGLPLPNDMMPNLPGISNPLLDPQNCCIM